MAVELTASRRPVGQPARFLVDTGAEVSVIPASTRNRCPVVLSHTWKRRPMSDATLPMVVAAGFAVQLQGFQHLRACCRKCLWNQQTPPEGTDRAVHRGFERALGRCVRCRLLRCVVAISSCCSSEESWASKSCSRPLLVTGTSERETSELSSITSGSPMWSLS